MDDKEILQNVKFNPADFIKFDVNVKLVESRHQQVAVTNTTKSVICYKCKGTSPEYIKIRPGYGYLQPGEEVAITVSFVYLTQPCFSRSLFMQISNFIYDRSQYCH